MVTVLGIESTAHTFGCGVIIDGVIASNVRDMHTTESGGLIPMDVKKHHDRVSESVYTKALMDAQIQETDIDALAISNAPGLAPSLLSGMHFAKAKAKELDIPIISVNHCIAHLEIGRYIGARDPVMLYASGANTQIIAYEGQKYRIFGETLDIGVGNFIDTIARHMGLGFPGGPKIEALAQQSTTFIELPYRIKGMDVSFSGIQTKIKQLLDRGTKKEDVCYSLQETVFPLLIEAAERALSHTQKKELLLAGGVACNKRFQEMCKAMCRSRNIRYFCPENSLLVDNGGMIGYLGYIMYMKDKKTYTSQSHDAIDINPKERTDDVIVTWK